MQVAQIKHMLSESQEIMEILHIIQKLDLPDCWLCAGMLRNYVWNRLSHLTDTKASTDVDVIFFDPSISYKETEKIQEKLLEQYPKFNWEVKNQIYMHTYNKNIATRPYLSSRDAIKKFPETCTAIAAQLDKNGKIILFTPYGIEDMVHFKIRPTPFFAENEVRFDIYKKRQETKKWKDTWKNLDIEGF